MSNTNGNLLPFYSDELKDVLGEPHGLNPSEAMMITGFRDGFKTYMLLTLLAETILASQGVKPIDDKRQLLMVVYTGDNDVTLLRWFYNYFKEASTNGSLPAGVFNSEGATDALTTIFDNTPYTLRFLYVNPGNTTTRDCIDQIEEIKGEYDLRGIFFDMPYLIVGPQDKKGTQLRDDIRTLRSYCAENNASLIFTHEFSEEARELCRIYHEENKPKQLLKDMAFKGYFQRSVHLDQEVDISLLVDYNYDGSNSISIQVDKARNRIVGGRNGYIEKNFAPARLVN